MGLTDHGGLVGENGDVDSLQEGEIKGCLVGPCEDRGGITFAFGLLPPGRGVQYEKCPCEKNCVQAVKWEPYMHLFDF